MRRWIEATGADFVERPLPTGGRGSIDEPVVFHGETVALSMSLPFLAQCASPVDIPPPFAPATLLEARAERTKRGPSDAHRRRVGICWTSTGANLNKRLRFMPEQFAQVWAPLHAV
jgi:hypothetical protein